YFYHNIVPTVLKKAPEERYYGNFCDKINKSAIGTTLFAEINSASKKTIKFCRVFLETLNRSPLNCNKY
ncbi:MAG: hypothetical protein U9R42_13805, partial [Bacteroidota bacterium]|nr:hypothetical protein [Bacteroidota bacterium]